MSAGETILRLIAIRLQRQWTEAERSEYHHAVADQRLEWNPRRARR